MALHLSWDAQNCLMQRVLDEKLMAPPSPDLTQERGPSWKLLTHGSAPVVLRVGACRPAISPAFSKESSAFSFRCVSAVMSCFDYITLFIDFLPLFFCF